jgi:hypothetical protein
MLNIVISYAVFDGMVFKDLSLIAHRQMWKNGRYYRAVSLINGNLNGD